MPKIKSPTPQELYRARKQREEQEKIAYLPPGLVNHGNTCFMNSVLQGLIATKLLSDLVHFEPISDQVQNHSSTLIASRRSPQLTNGHGLAGPYEQQWIDSMPLGDIFLTVVHRAWQVQKLRKRESLSPKPILGILGRKYDQYLDFAQQDAHEFLRILLDSMRMEELDVIKKRQPPPPAKQRSRRHRTTITSSSFPSSANVPDPTSFSLNPIREEERLTSMVDMIFGGSLTSILVCQKCKHISQTYEDFNDLSLSIKAEDYIRERKRDRLKTLAKKLASFNASPNSLTTSFSAQRASSVPPTPHKEEVQFGESDPPITTDEPRRRSFDVADHKRREEGIRIDGPTNETTSTDEREVELKPGKKENKEKGKERNKDWSKLGRRISASVGLAKPFKEKDRNGRPRDREAISDSLVSSSNSTPRASISDDLPHQSTSLERHPDDFPKRPKPLQLPQPSSSSSIASNSSSTSFSHLSRSKSPKVPKATPAETAYLRRILADVPPSPPLNPFFFFQNGTNPSASQSTPQTWLKPVGKVTGIEECLRLFTAVEVLDNENRVGCRHCWKLENGANEATPSPENEDESDDDSDLDGDSSGDASLSAATSSLQAVSLPTSLSTPSISMYSHSNLSDDGSVVSLPTVGTSVSDSGAISKTIPSLTVVTTVSSQEEGATDSNPGGLPIPSISTAPPSPDDTILQPLTARPHGSFPILNTALSSANDVGSSSADTSIPDTHIPSNSQLHDSESTNPLLAAPRSSRHRPKTHVDSADESSDGESDVSVSTSLHSADSSSQVNGNHSVASSSKPKPRKKPKPVIMRPAYKRYLIATPPPVLVIHLKRFQQISKSVISFSSGFKKLDDYVAFPEYLDLAPFLAPKKEDFGLGSGETKVKPRSKEVERCMYRLYAVVVHTGSMLGGHYFAYTALPQSSEPTSDSSLADQANASPQAERQWAYISDTAVRLTTKEEVLKAKAYLCMYERM